jgi:hypothetical protein
MATLHVFDPALCCSTGICGPEVDEDLVRFAADLEWLKDQGVEVRRFNLAQEPNAFAADALVRQTLQREGVECLPLLIVDGQVAARGTYPERPELSRMAGLEAGAAASRSRSLPLQALPVQGCAPGSGWC